MKRGQPLHRTFSVSTLKTRETEHKKKNTSTQHKEKNSSNIIVRSVQTACAGENINAL